MSWKKVCNKTIKKLGIGGITKEEKKNLDRGARKVNKLTSEQIYRELIKGYVNYYIREKGVK